MRTSRAAKAPWADAGLGAAAIVIGLASLWYPFGRDQGLFYYVGREWLERGAIPYRDVWDHKTPLIYAVHAAAIAVFGAGMGSIRVVELLLMPVVGWLASGVATPIGEPRTPGSVGAAWLMGTLAYQGCLTFWDTAQCEVWCAAFALASSCAALRIQNVRSAALWAGAFAAIAVWFKPPAVVFAPLALGAVFLRARRATSVTAFALGFAAISAAIVGYFAVHGALPDMYDIVVGANAYYATHEQPTAGEADFLLRYVVVAVYGPLLIVPVLGSAAACVWALSTRRPAVARRYGLFFALVAASAAFVAIQMKMYFYHWGSLVAALAYVGAVFYRDVVSFWACRISTLLAQLAGTAACAALALGLFHVTPSSAIWYETSAATLSYVRGLSSRADFARTFDVPHQNYAYADSENVGRWLRQHAQPGDTLAVRAFEPQIYATSGLHHTGRFFWTAFLTDWRRAYARDRWRLEDAAVFHENPPDYVVALLRAYDPIDSCRWFVWLGYRKVHRVGRFCVLQRVSP